MKYRFDHICQKTSPVETDEVLTIACPNEKTANTLFQKSNIPIPFVVVRGRNVNSDPYFF